MDLGVDIFMIVCISFLYFLVWGSREGILGAVLKIS